MGHIHRPLRNVRFTQAMEPLWFSAMEIQETSFTSIAAESRPLRTVVRRMDHRPAVFDGKMLKSISTCPVHPKYQAKRPPHSKCRECEEIWLSKVLDVPFTFTLKEQNEKNSLGGDDCFIGRSLSNEQPDAHADYDNFGITHIGPSDY